MRDGNLQAQRSDIGGRIAAEEEALAGLELALADNAQQVQFKEAVVASLEQQNAAVLAAIAKIDAQIALAAAWPDLVRTGAEPVSAPPHSRVRPQHSELRQSRGDASHATWRDRLVLAELRPSWRCPGLAAGAVSRGGRGASRSR